MPGAIVPASLLGLQFASDGTICTTEGNDLWKSFSFGPLQKVGTMGLALATAIGTSTTVGNLHGGDIFNTPEPASLMLCLLGGVLLVARKLHS